MNKTIHIVCLDAPSPPDYGGAIDMYFKVKALALLGNRIVLHYFDYKERRSSGALKDICAEVYTYKRKSFLSSLSTSTPYIVSSRINHGLVAKLNQDSNPILLEGIHCTGIIPFINNPSRIIIRMHNEEESYYRSLYSSSRSFGKKYYFLAESLLIRKYQAKLSKDLKLACLSETDIVKFNSKGFKNVHFIPCFVPWRHNTSIPGKGSYCLYHGNMAIAENERAAEWLMENVFADSEIPFVIAGNKIPADLVKKASAHRNVTIANDPPIEKLEGLIRDAHINILPSMNSTGVKLKLLHALFAGRFCISNHEGVKGSGIHKGVWLAEKPEEIRALVNKLMELPFQHLHIEERREMAHTYDNLKNAGSLNELW